MQKELTNASYTVRKLERSFHAQINMPGSKSITIRDLALAALANGVSVIKSPGVCDDTFRMADSLRRMGIHIDEAADGTLTVHGTNGRFPDHPVELNVGQSATSTRLLMAVCALREGTTCIDGHESMRVRPNKYLLDALQHLCADVRSTNDGYLPAWITGVGQRIDKIVMSGDKSSQYFSALLQIAPLLTNGLTIDVQGDLVSKPYIDITINEMAKFGIHVDNDNYRSFHVAPQTYKPVDLVVEGDASAASYVSALATVHGGQVTINNLGSSTKQGDYGFFSVCERLGARIERTATTTTVIGPRDGRLTPLSEPIDMEMMPDVAVTLMAMAPFIPGTTKITGLSTLRIKECDRIAAPATEMRKLGIEVVEGPDWMEISYWDEPPVGEPLDISTYHDHRIAMSLAVLGTKTGGLNITNCDCVDKTYPDFWRDLDSLYI